MNRDLFLAILSMDSYNRGYGQGISGLAAPELNSDGTPRTIIKIGNATLNGDSIRLLGPDAQLSGFYAIAYNWNGERVISYRGTDNLSVLTDSSNDILNGWLVGGGAQGGITGGAQAPLSIEFYKAVVGVDNSGNFTANPFANNITLTGHSLGGGLAGYVASLYGRRAKVTVTLAITPLLFYDVW
jgi:hypothetical protein